MVIGNSLDPHRKALKFSLWTDKLSPVSMNLSTANMFTIELMSFLLAVAKMLLKCEFVCQKNRIINLYLLRLISLPL